MLVGAFAAAEQKPAPDAKKYMYGPRS